MSSIQERLQLKRVPLDTWNVREQLCLASAVVRSGDQNWMSVSRALKTIGEPNRPADWYSQKSCAAQYGALLEHVETPKRKKRNSEGGVETPQESILKRLTEQRIQEIQNNIAEMNQQYEQLKNEITEVRNTNTPEERLHELWSGIEAAKRAREKESARRAAWLKEREDKRARAERTWRPNAQPTAVATSSTPSSPLLSSLLKSTPVVTTPQHITHPANVVDAISPSAGAPTLSLLLEQPHENKHAAIEHIKSQLVQIEHQLKASTSSPSLPPSPSLPSLPPPLPLPTPLPTPSVDIDDIEIKAEDVYAFRDIDINIPPVAAMHKGTQRVEKQYKKEDEQTDEPPPPIQEEIKMETEETEQIVEPAIVETTDVEMTEEVPIELPPEVPEKPPTPPQEPEVRVSFPEVKFPTTEIKVIQPEVVKVKEEIQPKEPETPPQEETVEVVQEEKEKEIEKEIPVVEEEQPVKEEIVEESQTQQQPEPIIEEVQQQQKEDEPPEVVSEDVMEIHPEDIPLPPEEPAAVPEPIKEPTPPPEVKEEKQEMEEVKKETEEQSGEEKGRETEEDRKDEDAEDSIPLKDMIKEEPLAQEKKEEDTHTETDDDTPMELSREEEKDGKKKRDYSRKKKSDSRTCSGSESAPESPSSSEAERQHRLWRKSVMLVYGRLCAHKYASLFLRPITDDEAPGYSQLIKRPMDLSTIRRNIDSGVIRTTAQFQRDVLLMLSNALIYNSTSHSVYTMAKEMFEEAQSQLGMLVAAQAHAGLVAPPARKRRPHDTAHKPRN
ncbi:bromodomain-containing protein 8-like [Colias croceus]|uniref:bromodomain-containing protein 8-like n=1 Tax=Colias crocea TaxID=72248 RepID=UPI001E27C15E|nr:bromodomain-containing protein 8-like [Colias croceus]